MENLSLLLEKTEDINLVEYSGHHVFESIFIMDNCEAAELLLEEGLDLSYVNENGTSLKEMILESKNATLKSFIRKYNQ